MIAILSLLLIVTLSVLVTRTAAVALTHTGLTRETARFQARSAFTGAGFTTMESEQVVGRLSQISSPWHPELLLDRCREIPL